MGEVGAHDRPWAGAGKGSDASEQVIERGPKTVDVGAAVDPFAADLLRRHIQRSADGHAGLSQAFVVVDRLDQAEIDELGDIVEREGLFAVAVALHQHVFRLDVSMNQFGLLVNVGEALGDLLGHLEHVDFGQDLVVFEQRRQAWPFDVFHGHEADALGFSAFDDLGDVAMVEPGEHLALTVEATDEVSVFFEPGDDGLDRQQPPIVSLACEVDGAHTACTELLDQVIGGKMRLLLQEVVQFSHLLAGKDARLDHEAAHCALIAEDARTR